MVRERVPCAAVKRGVCCGRSARKPAMVERSQRPMTEDDLRVLEKNRERAVGKVQFEARTTFLGVAAGLALGFVWQVAFHFGDRSASFWPHVALIAFGALVGSP